MGADTTVADHVKVNLVRRRKRKLNSWCLINSNKKIKELNYFVDKYFLRMKFREKYILQALFMKRSNSKLFLEYFEL